MEMTKNWLEMIEKGPFTFRDLAKSRKIYLHLVSFEPIEVPTGSAPQNDRLNLSFVMAKNWLEMVKKRQLGQVGWGGYY